MTTISVHYFKLRLMLFYAKWQMNNYIIICLFLALHAEKYVPTLNAYHTQIFRDIKLLKVQDQVMTFL